MILTESALKAKRKELEKMKQQLILIRREKALSISQADGDGWHDNAGFEHAEQEEHRLMGEIRDFETKLNSATIVKDEETQKTIVKVDSTVKVRIDYGDGEITEMNAHVVATPMQMEDEITLDSPIGQAIFGNPVGYISVCKLPNGGTAKVEILEIEV